MSVQTGQTESILVEYFCVSSSSSSIVVASGLPYREERSRPFAVCPLLLKSKSPIAAQSKVSRRVPSPEIQVCHNNQNFDRFCLLSRNTNDDASVWMDKRRQILPSDDLNGA